ncbi:hypothetical protein CCOS865_02807 [Pseudomonas reidholzensis]|uniref:Cupin type-1 domain-containing protein n=1 Tax=Pseudomonas reidholzensis TaxID=1785162 RepID=A0A383RU14_9PSED|nr:cupin domain-containing protein [Pseudomonas reidholzensis]SYX90540.1 hypothetical protein CCOS865_02807 [Pseudomonas reidholzensis]
MSHTDVIDGSGAPAQTLRFEDDGATPNSVLPVLLYRLKLDRSVDKAEAFEALFAAHGWTPLWRDGIFDYHHFHPNAHEALGVARGQARVTLGGEAGQTLTVKAGDVLVLPAGTGHRCVHCSDDFLVVGAYPQGQEDYDIQRPDARLHKAALARIARVAKPQQDPVAGERGALLTEWRLDG